jgi:NAD(P)-dependent dehydrogenase (short-subunit alcohol dehydrogenase family)
MGELVVITGGATGIGAATATRLVARGDRVVILDINEPEPAERVDFVRCDLGDVDSIDAALATLPELADSLINVAGVANADPMSGVVAVNFLGLRHITEAFAPRIQSGGTIVNVASSAGRDWPTNAEAVRGLLDTPDFASGMRWLEEHASVWSDNPYKFSKQCAAAYTYRAAELHVAHGVRVNCVNPGAVETRLTAEFRGLIGSEMYDWIGKQIGRTGTPEEIAEVVEFLAVGDCAWLNGVEITVDGGYYAGIVGGWIRPETSPVGEGPPAPNAAPLG